MVSKHVVRMLGIIVIVVAGLVAGAACAPAAAPGTPTAEVKPMAMAATAAKPTATTAPAAKPTQAPTPAATTSTGETTKPDASANLKAEWDKVLAAAKQEGKVVVAGGPGTMYREAAMAFKQAYPDIALEFDGAATTPNIQKFLSERQGGQYLWDLYIGSMVPLLRVFKPQGAFDPLKPALLLPDVLDNSKWMGGLDDGWADNERQYFFNFQHDAESALWVNRDLVPESQLSTIDQLVDPKWKGKIITRDSRVMGKANAQTVMLLKSKGEDWVRKLYSQDLVMIADARQHAEAFVRGSYPIAFGIDTDQLHQFQKEGLWGNFKQLEPNNTAAILLSTGFGSVGMFNKAPHPNAAKVYANWLLSQDGMKAWAEATRLNTRRLDVKGPVETAPDSNKKYVVIFNEDGLPLFDKAMEIAKEFIK